MSYSNATHDTIGTQTARAANEGAVRRMYETAPYPDLGAEPKDAKRLIEPVLRHLTGDTTGIRFLDVGCGTGHLLVGTAKAYPGWSCHGIDLSDASLSIARQLAEMHGVGVTIERGSYLDPLPFQTKKFDLIAAQGTIHHSADPVAALKALSKALARDGILIMHLYGWRLDRRKFEVKEMLSMFEPDLFNHQRRFELYRQLMRYQRRWTLRRLASLSPLDLYVKLKTASRNLRRRRRGVSWSLPWTDDYATMEAPWIDHFCHPCERAYEVPDVGSLVTASGFEIVEMRAQGRENQRWVPPEWRKPFEMLEPWQRYRLMELLSPSEQSFNIVLRKS